MIQANELRIGNWVFIAGLDRYVKVSAIFKTHFRCEDLNGISYEESIRINYQPIPLTPEILEKFGFKVQSVESTYYNNFELTTIATSYEILDGIFSVEFVKNTHDNNVVCNHKCKAKIDYLHQLQNLIHAKTGTELTYNP
jgi:hypothetical protein